MDTDRPTPAQQRLLDELLAVGQPRPGADPDLAPRVRETVEAGVAGAAGLVPSGERLVVTKSSLAALECDGRYLDHEATRFVWSADAARGTLTHLAVELDWHTGRREEPAVLVARAWDDLAARRPDLAAFLGTLDLFGAATLRHEAECLVAELRDLWPPIPRSWRPRLEQRLAASLARGAVHARGRPDLVIGRVRPDRVSAVVVELRTGWRRPAHDRADLRYYALLFTLKYRVPPFRVATYYVAEGAWEVEDVTADVLDAAARRLVDGVRRAAVLRYRPPDRLRLVPGAHCRWCARAPGCSAAAAATGAAG